MINGVSYHELAIAAALGAIMGLLGYFITRALLPLVEKVV